MYTDINTVNDVIRERFLYGAELAGKFGFPQLPPTNADLTGIKAVPFNLAGGERNPKNSICHFFVDDHRFERAWNNPDKYFGILENFRYVCTPDFSFYDGMPMAMKVWQVYRSRALGWWFHVNGLKVVPSVGWGSPDSFEWCFDGLSQGGTVAVSTTGCCFADGWQCFGDGYREMIRRLSPAQVLVVGHDLPEELQNLAPVVCRDGFGAVIRGRASLKASTGATGTAAALMGATASTDHEGRRSLPDAGSVAASSSAGLRAWPGGANCCRTSSGSGGALHG